MRLHLVILAVSMMLLGSCASKHVATLPPAPVMGKDIERLKKGDIANFEGTLFSDFYLNSYLQWKATQ